jgi:hypothetical protein
MPRTAATNPNRPRGNALTRWIAAHYVIVPPNTPPEWLIQMNYDFNRRAGRQEAGALQMAQFETGDPEATLAGVRAPTLKKKYPGLGHYAYREDPPTVEADILAFLSGELDSDLRVITRSAWTPPAQAAA